MSEVPGSEDTLSDTESGHVSIAQPEVRQVVLDKYTAVWKEFYQWSQLDNRHYLENLRKPVARQSPRDYAVHAQSHHGTATPQDASVPISISKSQDVIELDADDFLNPSPPYESCTLSYDLIGFTEVDKVDLDIMPFMPYADDPAFDVVEYSQKFPYLAWQHIAEKDPDVELIQAETLRRLQFHFGSNSLALIDSLGVFPTRSRVTNEDGLIWRVSQRDGRNWPGRISSLPALPNRFEPAYTDQRGRVNSLMTQFCPDLMCLSSYCLVHSAKYPKLDRRTPRKTSQELRSKAAAGKPCGHMCFLNATEDFMLGPVENNTVENVGTLLDTFPDDLPCTLVPILRMPCRDIFYYRCQTILDEDDVMPAPSDKEFKRKKRNVKEFAFKDGRRAPDDPYEARVPPCHHHGPCRTATDCACKAHSLHCSVNCRCDEYCELRWDGCNCANRGPQRGPLCTADKCACRMAGRECIVGRDALDVPVSSVAKNTLPKLEVRRSEYGFGAFATGPIPANSYIGEYAAELLFDYNDKKDHIRKHTDRNYMFEVSVDTSHKHDLLVMDAARVGNETRYMNHAEVADGNVFAYPILVNNDYHIKFYAGSAERRIERGEELLFHYGDKYWVEQDRAA
ncbi:SET domain-containing protein [Auriscalpium vulgare]|uniref:SET domain-containing protein n=1 Tax=Auriscalpium vulgare TaxID=40419 RepID=A0ACB8S6C3_9AGAM|nr:SET domain-containing protein [Auriscalpium vulgare]